MRTTWGFGLSALFPAASVFFLWSIGMAQGNGAGAHFLQASSPWIQTATLTAAGGVADDQFGRSVAVNGDIIVVGTSSGAAYVFVKPSAGWSGT